MSKDKVMIFPRINKSILMKYPVLGNPEIPDNELQDLVNECEFLVLLHSSILYGLIEGDAKNIKVEKCIRVLEYAKTKNIVPNQKDVVSYGKIYLKLT